MKLQCQVEVINRLHTSHNISSKGKYLKSTLGLGKEPKCKSEYFILHFSSVNKTGVKYRVKCIKQVFVKCLNEGKSTIRFEEPPHDLCIKTEAIQLKCFIKLLKQCLTGDTMGIQLSNLANIGMTSKDIAPTKLTIRDRSEFPEKGFPRMLQQLGLSGLKLCNFRRDILMLKHLTVLDLSNNEIVKIPPEFGTMPNLSELNLANNRIGCQPDINWKWIHSPNSKVANTLKLLDLSGNQLNTIPSCIWMLKNIITLKFNDNNLVRVPASLGRLTKLRYLSLSKNKLETLPCGLLQCKLEELDLSSNNFHIVSLYPLQHTNAPWDFYIGSLVLLAGKTVLQHKIHYASNIIPFHLVDVLDCANICMCGGPVVSDAHCLSQHVKLNDYFKVVIFDHSHKNITFEYCFCSPKCYKDYYTYIQNNFPVTND